MASLQGQNTRPDALRRCVPGRSRARGTGPLPSLNPSIQYNVRSELPSTEALGRLRYPWDLGWNGATLLRASLRSEPPPEAGHAALDAQTSRPIFSGTCEIYIVPTALVRDGSRPLAARLTLGRPDGRRSACSTLPRLLPTSSGTSLPRSSQLRGPCMAPDDRDGFPILGSLVRSGPAAHASLPANDI
jgi:hypothetical protein